MRDEGFASLASKCRGMSRAVANRNHREFAGRLPRPAYEILKLISTMTRQGTGFPAFSAGWNFQVFTV